MKKHVSMLFLAALTAGYAGPPKDSAQRIQEIDTKYGLVFAGETASRDGTRLWGFASNIPAFHFKGIMIYTPANPSEKEINASIIGAMNCAEFYEEMLKRENQHP